MIFENTNLRQFQFAFLFAPENEKETEQAEQICRRLRFHAAPTISGGDSGFTQGRLMSSPSRIAIDFHTLVDGNWVSNETMPYIPRIFEGYIEAIAVDYAPSGLYSTFSNGFPVAIQLVFSFRETRIIDKKMIEKGY